MRKEVIEINGKFYPRYKKWFQRVWKYPCKDGYVWTSRKDVVRWCGVDTELRAEEILKLCQI